MEWENILQLFILCLLSSSLIGERISQQAIAQLIGDQGSKKGKNMACQSKNFWQVK